jgi:hypothetical protein
LKLSPTVAESTNFFELKESYGSEFPKEKEKKKANRVGVPAY